MKVERAAALEHVAALVGVRAVFGRGERRRKLLSLISLGAAEQHPASGQLAGARTNAVSRRTEAAEKADDELERAAERTAGRQCTW